MRTSLLGAFACAALVSAATGAAASPALAEMEPASPCVVPAYAGPSTSSLTTVDGIRAYEKWIAAPAGQAAAEAVDGGLADAFGTGTKEDNFAALRRGLIGTAIDNASQSIVVVVDPGYASAATLRSKLAAAANAAAAVAPGVGGAVAPGVRVQPGCHSAAELLEAAGVLEARRWHPDAGRARFAFHLDASDSPSM